MDKENREPTPTVLAIGKLNFEGHIIPHTWYQHVTYTTNGGEEKVDLQAIVILSDIVYWYRPRAVLNEGTGKLVSQERRFSSDKLQRNYQQISEQFGLSKTQAARAVKRLRDLGLITMEFRTVGTAKGPIPNVLYLEPVPERLAEITHGQVRVSSQICKDTPANSGGYADNFVGTNTENTSENTSTEEDNPATQKPDYLDAVFRFSQRPSERNWADPPQAGGADDWDQAVDAFALHVKLDPAALPASKRREWARVLREEVGAVWRAGPGTVAEVIRQVPDSEFGWKTWASPHQAREDLGVLVGQHQNGGIQKTSQRKETRDERNQRILAEARAKRLQRQEAQPEPVLDVEYAIL